MPRNRRHKRRCTEMLPVDVESGKPRRPAACSNMSGMSEDLANMRPPRMVAPLKEPNPAPHLYDDMSKEELHMLCKKHGYHDRDARPLLVTRLLAMDQLARKCAREDPEAGSSVAKKTPPHCCTAIRLRAKQRSSETPSTMVGLGDE